MTMYRLEQFLVLETAVWDALKSDEQEKDSNLLAEHFLGGDMSLRHTMMNVNLTRIGRNAEILGH